MNLMDKILEYIADNYITGLATIAALLSAIYAYRSNVISRRALNLSQQDYLNRQANFSIYIIDAFRYRRKIENEFKKILLFNVTLNNKSQMKNSFRAILEIEFIRKDNSVARVPVEHNPLLEKEVSKANVKAFPTDIKADEKSIETGWLLFEEPASIFKEFRIEKFRIKVTDIQENPATFDISIVKEIDNETPDNKASNL